jgi:hypothetical protein
MPDFEVTAPNGRRFIVTAPEGSSQDEVLRYAQQNMPPPEQSTGRSLGIGARDAAVGALSVPGMLYDAAAFPINLIGRGIEALGGPSLPRIRSASENLDAVGDAVGLPRAETPGERTTSAVARSVAGLLPTMGAGAVLQGAGQAPNLVSLLTANPVSQVGGAVGAGLGARAAEGSGPLGELAGSLVGGIGGAGAVSGLATAGRSAGALVQPFTEEGRRRMVGDILLRGSSSPATLEARIRAGLADTDRRLQGSPVTTAAASRDPGLLMMEGGLRSQVTPNSPTGQSPAVAIRDLEATRNANRGGAIARLQDGSNPEARGATIRSGLQGADEAMGARVDQLFTVARDRNANTYSTAPVLEEARRATRLFDPAQGGGGVPAQLQSVLDDIERIGSLSLSQAQNIRSRLGEIAGQASVAGDNRLASAAGAVSQSIERTIDDPRWMQAVAARREQGAAVGRDATGTNAAGQILREDRFGAPVMADAAVAPRATANLGNARQVMEAHYKALDDARRARLPVEQIETLTQQMRDTRQALRGQFMDDLFSRSATTTDALDASGNASRALSPAQFRRFFEENAPVARSIFEPAEYAQLQRLASDFAETGASNAAGGARGSNTAQNLSVANLIARSSNGLIDPGMPLAQTLGGAMGLMRIVYSSPEAATRDLLTRAMVDPNFAQTLLSRATPAATSRAAGYLERTLMERLGGAIQEGSGRAAIRAGVATTGQQEALPQGR